MLKTNYVKRLERENARLKEQLRLTENYETLLKKYQDNPDTLKKEYDELIYESIVSIIHCNLSFDILRDDIINNVIALIKIRPFIINYNSNNSSD